MAKEKTIIEDSIKFQIKSVDLLGSNLQLPGTSLPVNPNFSFSITVEQKLDFNKRSLIVIINVDISTAENLDFKLGSASVGCLFSIENFDEVVKMDKNKQANIPKGVIDLLNSIAISTTRGVLSQVFKGTFLHHAILPIIDPKSLKMETA